MSEYKLFLDEKNKIDHYFDRGFQIINIFENMSGTFVDFIGYDGSNQKHIDQIQLLTAEARKYITSKLIVMNEKIDI